MEATMVGGQASVRTPLPAARKLAAAGMAGISLALIYLQVMIIGMVIPPLAVFAGVTLIVVGVVTLRRRWTPLLGVVWSVLLYGGNLGEAIYNLTHPEDAHGFGLNVVILALVLTAVAAGGVATLQSYRAVESRGLPRWLSRGLLVLSGLVVGAILVAAIPRAGTDGGLDPAALAGLPALGTVDGQFDRREIRAKVGETIVLRLDNRDGQGHSFDIDELNVHAPMPPGKTGLALFKPAQPGTYTFYCGVPAHKEFMTGTLIVE